MPGNETLLQLEDVCKHYHDGKKLIHAVDHVSLSMDKGEFVSLSGPSGSGKTTLLNLIGGLERPSSGHIFLEGEDITQRSPNELTLMRLHKIGFVFQSYNLVPVFNALENVSFIMQMQGIPTKEASERAMQMLQKVGLESQAHRRPAELSGGQQQRVAVARALVGNPSIVLADEPTANLDSKNSMALMELMQHLNDQQKTTLLISSHDPEIIEFAPRRIRLKDGRILVDDQPS